jgi:hypothetical protein
MGEVPAEVGVPVICPVVSPRVRPVGNAPAVTVYCTVPEVAVADNVTVDIAVPEVHEPILELAAGETHVVTGATPKVNERVVLPPAVELAATTNELVATAVVVVPEMTPLAEPRLSPEGNEPEFIL